MGLGEARFEEARHFGIMDNARSAVVSNFPNKPQVAIDLYLVLTLSLPISYQVRF